MTKPAGKLALLRTFLPEPVGARLEPHARLIRYAPEQTILIFGTQTTEAYVVLEGRAQAELMSPDGREVILGDLEAGSIFGEIAALDNQPRTATVTAITDCQVACIPGQVFRDEMMADPQTARWVTTLLVNRIRSSTEKIFELNALAVRNRLHCELLRLSLAAGIDDNRAVIEPAPTHVQLAARIGTHREAVTRELQFLDKQDIISRQRRVLTVNDVGALAEIVREAAGEVEMVSQVEEQLAG